MLIVKYSIHAFDVTQINIVQFINVEKVTVLINVTNSLTDSNKHRTIIKMAKQIMKVLHRNTRRVDKTSRWVSPN